MNDTLRPPPEPPRPFARVTRKVRRLVPWFQIAGVVIGIVASLVKLLH